MDRAQRHGEVSCKSWWLCQMYSHCGTGLPGYRHSELLASPLQLHSRCHRGFPRTPVHHCSIRRFHCECKPVQWTRWGCTRPPWVCTASTIRCATINSHRGPVVGRNGVHAHSTVAVPGQEPPWLGTLFCRLLWTVCSGTMVVQVTTVDPRR